MGEWGTQVKLITDLSPMLTSPLVYDSIDGSRCILQSKDKDVKS